MLDEIIFALEFIVSTPKDCIIMRSICIVILCAFTVMVATDSTRYDLSKARELFEQFIKDYDRSYKDTVDKEKHFAAFKNNLIQLNKDNENNPNGTFVINRFTDYTAEEWVHINGFEPY